CAKTPGSRGPSASNNVSLPRRASAPISVNVSCRSMTCMPRWRTAKSAIVSRRSTQKATWSRVFGLIGPRIATAIRATAGSDLREEERGAGRRVHTALAFDRHRDDRALRHRPLELDRVVPTATEQARALRRLPLDHPDLVRLPARRGTELGCDKRRRAGGADGHRRVVARDRDAPGRRIREHGERGRTRASRLALVVVLV